MFCHNSQKAKNVQFFVGIILKWLITSISRKGRKRNVPYLSLGEREEETLLSYVTCRKLKLSQMLCIIDGGHKV